jgi:fluoride exporter
LVGVLTWVGIACFGALGAVARFRLDSAVSARFPSDFPLGTLAVNLTGALGLGILVGIAPAHRVVLLLGTGFAGGYTTFSTWMVESVRLGEGGNVVLLLRNLWVSMLVGFAVVAAGFYLGQAIG